MELRHLRYFKVVAELQHFRNAADKLCITQPALSNQIKQLEQEINTNLFDRVGRRVKLSENGELVLAFTKRILNEVEFLKEAVLDIETGQAGNLKVGVLQSTNALYLRSLVVEFDRKYPNISLRVEEMTNHDIESKVASGDIDIGVGFILQKEYRNIQLEKLFNENWKLVLSPSHAMFAENIMRGETHNLKAILLPEYFETRKIINNYFFDNNIKYTSLTEVNSISSILDLVESGASFSILPEAFSVLKSNHRLALFDLDPKLSPRTIGLLMAKDRVRKKTVEEFCKLIKSQLTAVPPYLPSVSR